MDSLLTPRRLAPACTAEETLMLGDSDRMLGDSDLDRFPAGSGGDLPAGSGGARTRMGALGTTGGTRCLWDTRWWLGRTPAAGLSANAGLCGTCGGADGCSENLRSSMAILSETLLEGGDTLMVVGDTLMEGGDTLLEGGDTFMGGGDALMEVGDTAGGYLARRGEGSGEGGWDLGLGGVGGESGLCGFGGGRGGGAVKVTGVTSGLESMDGESTGAAEDSLSLERSERMSGRAASPPLLCSSPAFSLLSSPPSCFVLFFLGTTL
jgi:hypothetical protein